MTWIIRTFGLIIQKIGIRSQIFFLITLFKLEKYFFSRVRLSYKYIRGNGLEIGAMHAPLLIPPTAKVKYADISSKEESMAKFPELNSEDLVDVDFITDGFTLTNVPDNSFDFIIANHILEHSQDPISAMLRWFQCLRKNGILFFSVPRIDRCFDKFRSLTSPQHIMEDHFLIKNDKIEEIKQRNKSHYQEWFFLSLPQIDNTNPPAPEILTSKVNKANDQELEIHFHTFSVISVKLLLNLITESKIIHFNILQLKETGTEIICILQK